MVKTWEKRNGGIAYFVKMKKKKLKKYNFFLQQYIFQQGKDKDEIKPVKLTVFSLS